MRMAEVPELGKPGAETLLQILDGEIAEFESWMRTNLNGGLSSMEQAILRTYIAWKIAPERFKG